jgi:hypothetical protein
MTLTCERCGRPFESRRRDARACSGACREALSHRARTGRPGRQLGDVATGQVLETLAAMTAQLEAQAAQLARLTAQVDVLVGAYQARRSRQDPSGIRQDPSGQTSGIRQETSGEPSGLGLTVPDTSGGPTGGNVPTMSPPGPGPQVTQDQEGNVETEARAAAEPSTSPAAGLEPPAPKYQLRPHGYRDPGLSFRQLMARAGYQDPRREPEEVRVEARCGKDPELYRLHQAAHYWAGDRWSCRTCDPVSVTPAGVTQ